MDLNWSGSSLVLNEELLSVLKTKECGDVLLQTKIEDNGTFYISPIKTNIFIADEERVKVSRYFSETINYYETKGKPSNSEAYILLVINNSLEETIYHQVAQTDQLFASLLKQVYLELPGISSISHFPYSVINEICELNSKYVEAHLLHKEDKGYLFFLREFISLCALSTRVLFDDSRRKYIFEIGSKVDSDFHKSIHLETVWNDTAFFKSKFFSTITRWVLDDKGIPNGHYLRRSVAQYYLLGFEDSSSLLQATDKDLTEIPDSLDNMFESVLNARSEKYVQNINKMKEDYIESFNQYSQMLSSVNTQAITNIFAITAAAYGIFLTKDNLESPLSFPGVRWILGFFIFTTLLILVNFIGSYCSLKSSKKKRRKFYSVMLGVADGTLEKIYDRINPNLPSTWLIPFIFLVLILCTLIYLYSIL